MEPKNTPVRIVADETLTDGAYVVGEEREAPGKPTSARYRRAVRRLEKRQQAQTEHDRIAARYQPSARELFPMLRQLLLTSRPVKLPARDVTYTNPDGTEKNVVHLEPVYGKPAFRNVLVEDETGHRSLL